MHSVSHEFRGKLVGGLDLSLVVRMESEVFVADVEVFLSVVSKGCSEFLEGLLLVLRFNYRF